MEANRLHLIVAELEDRGVKSMGARGQGTADIR